MKSFTYWPSDNGLWTVSSPWTALSYDPLGRLAAIDSAGDSGFAYDGLAMIAEYDGAGTVLARYVHGPGPSTGSGQADEPLVRYDGSGTTNKQSLHADERGSITALSYGSPYAPTINRYDEYGKPQPGNIGRFQYTGQMWLSEAGLYHYKARAYSPTFGGRFLQTDPAGYESGINLYAYVGNDPVNWIDPLGLTECENPTPDGCGTIVVFGNLGGTGLPQRSTSVAIVGSGNRTQRSEPPKPKVEPAPSKYCSTGAAGLLGALTIGGVEATIHGLGAGLLVGEAAGGGLAALGASSLVVSGPILIAGGVLAAGVYYYDQTHNNAISKKLGIC